VSEIYGSARNADYGLVKFDERGFSGNYNTRKLLLTFAQAVIPKNTIPEMPARHAGFCPRAI